MFRRLLLRLPPVARRDERIRDLRRKNHRLRKVLQEGPSPARIPKAPKPSYRALMYQERRLIQLGNGETSETAERLSLAIRAPFSRLDFNNVGDRIVFGEVTPRPGGPQWFGPDLDAMLGDTWERAIVRNSRDIADGMTPEFQWGPARDASREESRT